MNIPKLPVIKAQKVQSVCVMCGNTYNTTLYDLVRRRLCSSCRASKYEKPIEDKLNELGINFKRNVHLEGCFIETKQNTLRMDFLFPDVKMVWEIDGFQHFNSRGYRGTNSLNRVQMRDAFKNQWLKDNGYCLIRASDDLRKTAKHIPVNYLYSLINKGIKDGNIDMELFRKYDFNN